MTHLELERFVSGGNDDEIDIDLLKQFTKYLMDLNENSNRIKWLWEILREFSQNDKKKFIKFCWAQEKLPSTKDEYERLQVIFSILPIVISPSFFFVYCLFIKNVIIPPNILDTKYIKFLNKQ